MSGCKKDTLLCKPALEVGIDEDFDGVEFLTQIAFSEQNMSR